MVNFSIKKHSQRFVNALSAWAGLGEIQYRCWRAWGWWGQGTAGLKGFLGLTPPLPAVQVGPGGGAVQKRSWTGCSSYSQQVTGPQETPHVKKARLSL